ncbi:hypothetical protein [Priestia megaterium]|uniref:hypothetical protein n=1 Tax=Priestia megaterium TaxID=1404 RepID=UPI000BFDA8E3|nr:hypothetical protein [Priestia megaterium]PGO60662.1 hypothetical protein CN981_08925 [Priestia megaterium]
MSEIMVTIDGKKYTWDEAERLGLLPKKQEQQSNVADGRSLEIIIDEDTKSFRLSVDDEEGVDIPKPLLIDIFEVSGFKSIKEIIEEDGVDEDALEELAQKMNLI